MCSTLQFGAVQRSRLSSPYRLPRISSKAKKDLEFSSSGKPLKFSGIHLLKKHDFFHYPVVKAAADAIDADGGGDQEIEISDGFEVFHEFSTYL